MIEKPDKVDKIETFHNALIQHGKISNRIYLMKLKKADPAQLIPAMNDLAARNGYTKVFAKIPAYQADIFLESGYQKEAEVPGFFHGQEAAIFLGRYFDPQRQHEPQVDKIDEITKLAEAKKNENSDTAFLPVGTKPRQCTPNDAEQMSNLYKEVFASYPFPIDSPRYLIDAMLDNVIYFGIEISGRLVSLSSAEMDTVSSNVEMTDFATLPAFRGNSFASRLLGCMKNKMMSKGIHTAYTIARAESPAMNITFGKAGYAYGGRLINNTNIAGQIESMNIWYKRL